MIEPEQMQAMRGFSHKFEHSLMASMITTVGFVASRLTIETIRQSLVIRISTRNVVEHPLLPCYDKLKQKLSIIKARLTWIKKRCMGIYMKLCVVHHEYHLFRLLRVRIVV